MLLGGNRIIANTALRRRLYEDITNNSLAHAYIIEGIRGSGRRTLAKNIAAALSCTSEGESLPCGKCKNCRDIFEDKCPDVITVGRDGKASLGVDAIRNLKSTLLAVPNNLEIKAYILEDADTMTDSAQNAFLLTLEEPPKNVYFFLICESSRALLETIRSRAATLRTDKLSNDEVSDYITSDKVPKTVSDAARSMQRNQKDDFDTLLIASGGSIGRATELLSPKELAPIKALRDTASRFIEAISPGHTGHPLTLLPEFSTKRDELSLQLDQIKTALRDLILLKKSETVPLCFYLSAEPAIEISDRFSEKRLLKIFDAVGNACDALSRNANVRLTMIDMLSSL